MAIPKHCRDEYLDDGVTVVRHALGGEWVETLSSAVDTILRDPGLFGREHSGGRPGRFHVNVLMSSWMPIFRRLALESPVAQIAREIIGADSIRFFYDQLFVKEPGTLAPTQWHQDLPFWPVRGTAIPSLWLALTYADLASSAVQYVRGSHNWNVWLPSIDPKKIGNDNMNRFAQRPDCRDWGAPEIGELTSYVLEPGDLVVHHPLIIHGAAGNSHPTRDRKAISLRYFGNGVVWDPRPNTMFFPGVSGLMKPGESVSSGEFFHHCY